MITVECRGCGTKFQTSHDGQNGNKLATICGSYECVARTTWTRERWESQLRMATARALAGVQLQPLDYEAAKRCGVDIDSLREAHEAT